MFAICANPSWILQVGMTLSSRVCCHLANFLGNPPAMKPLGIYLQYHYQIGSIGSEQEKALYSSCFFTDEKRQYTDENDEQAGWQVEGDG